MKRSLLAIAVCACMFSVNAQVYKWIDADGKTQYGDAPPKNANAKAVSGGVTVVPAIVVPKAPPAVPPAAQSKPEADVNDGRARTGNGSNPANTPAQASAPADSVSASRAEARRRAIDQCKQNRGVDCEREVEAHLYGPPTEGYVPGSTQGNTPGSIVGGAPLSVPGWSQPPIRPAKPLLTTRIGRTTPRSLAPPEQESAPAAPESKPSAGVKPKG